MATKKQKKEKTIENIDWDFHYESFLDIEYDTERNCQEAGCDSICRCSKIENIKIKNLDIVGFGYLIHERLFGCRTKVDDLNIYIIDRIIRCLHTWEDSFDVNTRNGYYGEEIGSISYNNKNEFCRMFNEVNQQTDLLSKVKKLLTFEYGYILPKIEKYDTAEIMSVNISDIKFPNDEYMKKVSQEDIKAYENYPYILCVVDHQFNIIDGYHRVIATKKNFKRKKVKVIRLSFKDTIL